MISVSEALDTLFALVRPVTPEQIPLSQANGRVLSKPATARRDQPPFAASAMDGYAVKSSDIQPGSRLRVVGEAAAGHAYDGRLNSGEALRIFTGAPLPAGADRVIIQEDVARQGAFIALGQNLDQKSHVRPRGADFKAGHEMVAPRRLGPRDIALLAAMNVDQVTVARQPVVAILSTGDELLMPGETPRPDQIIASNSFGLHAMLSEIGCDARLLPIARDNEESLRTAFSLCEDADLVLTIGGASVGDHDLVGQVTADLGMERAFYKIAMRPGKPLMAGRLKTGPMMIGLPGNPVSAMVCGTVFVTPVIRAMQGLGKAPAPERTAPLGDDIGANGPREHYMRAQFRDGQLHVEERQDSALLSVLAEANALVIRPPHDPARAAGDIARFIQI